MKLFTKEVDKQLFAQYPKGSNLENQMVVAKIFNPYGRGVWYLLNSDPEDPDYIWAIVDLFEPDMGSVSRSELQTVKVPPFGLGLERDIYFSPKPAKEVWEGIMRGERFEHGGSIATQNKDMLENQTANVMHHAKELHEAVKNTDIEIMPWVLTKLQRATTDLQDITHYLEGEEAKFAAGGMTAGRWYKDNSGKEFRYIGESQGKLLFNDGEKIVEKDEDDFEDEPKEKKLFGFFADGGRVKGRNNETGETFGVVIGSVQKADDELEGATKMNVRTSYSSRISEEQLLFDKNGNLYQITDFGYGLEGQYPDTSAGSGHTYNADKKETLEVLSKKYNSAFAKKLIELAKDSKMAEGGETTDEYARGGEVTPYIVWVSKDGEKRELYGEFKSMRAADMKMKKLWETGEYKSMGNKSKSSYEKEGFYADGGETAAAEHNIKQAKYGGKMAKGGGIYSSDSLYYLQVLKDGEEVDKKKFRARSLKEAKEISEDEYEGDYEKKYGKNLTFIVSEAMGMGGKVKFEDKVKAVQKSLLKRKKVAPVVQKDYGKTYNKKEALESARRIIGAQTAKWEKRNKK